MKPTLLLCGLFLTFASEELVGGKKDDFGCIESAGYAWCEKLEGCVRSWELQGEWDEECHLKKPDAVQSEEVADNSRMSSSEDGSGSKDEFSSERASSDNSGAANSSDGEDKKATVRAWFYEFSTGVIFLFICVPICAFLIERKRRQEYRRRAVMVQMLADDCHNTNALSYVETVAVKETEMTSGVAYDRFSSLV